MRDLERSSARRARHSVATLMVATSISRNLRLQCCSVGWGPVEAFARRNAGRPHRGRLRSTDFVARPAL